MARTANRQQLQAVDIPSNSKKSGKVSRVGIYARLSHGSKSSAGGLDRQSDSLENQKLVMMDYIDLHKDLVLVEIFEDDGKTGTDFERAGFIQLMNKVRAKEIDCVMVKDFSRFARNNSEASDYLEKIFPFMGVRFISVLDDYDSNRPNCTNEQLVVNLKNLIHENYAMDISRKIHATVAMKQSRGEVTGGNMIAYGYQLKPGEKYLSLADSFRIVEQIFRMALDGMSCYAIARKLTEQKVLTPTQYKKTGQIYVFDGFEGSNSWYTSTVDRILTNPTYTGDTYCHKSQRKLYEQKERVYFEKDDWIHVENTHPAIVSKEDFEKVQSMKKEAGERFRKKCKVKAVGKVYQENNLFEGKIFCGDCGTPMYWMEEARYRNHERFWAKVYKCGAFVTNHNQCSSKRIVEEDVYAIVQNAIVSRITLMEGCFAFIKTETEESFTNVHKHYMNRQKKEEKKLTFLENQKAVIYMEYAEGECSAEIYEQRKKRLLLDIESQKNLLKNLNSKIKKLDKALKQELKLQKAWISGKKQTVISRAMIEEFIEQIRIYDEKRIEIDFTFEDEIQSLIETREEIELWQVA